MTDLIVLVADSYQEKVMEALLPRIPVSSGTRNFSFDIIRNPGHDSGNYNDSHEILRSLNNQYKYALVLFDFEGTGVEHLTREAVEDDVRKLLDANGWKMRNDVIVIYPELENWIWLDNVHVQDAIGWEKEESLYEWAKGKGYIKKDKYKPDRPKETLEEALRVSGTSKSASIYKKIATNVSYRKCQDKAFIDLLRILQIWFPPI